MGPLNTIFVFTAPIHPWETSTWAFSCKYVWKHQCLKMSSSHQQKKTAEHLQSTRLDFKAWTMLSGNVFAPLVFRRCWWNPRRQASLQPLPSCRCSAGIRQLWRPHDSHYFRIHRSVQRVPGDPCRGIIRYVCLSIPHLLAANYIKAISVPCIKGRSEDLRCSTFPYTA